MKWHIDISYSDPATRNHAGVFRIEFGDRYFMGSSINIASYVSAMESKMQKALHDKRYDKSTYYYHSLLDHIGRSKIRKGKLVILQECKTEDELKDLEIKYFPQTINDPACINPQDVFIKLDLANNISEMDMVAQVPNIDNVVYKLWYMDKFYIAKAHYLLGSLKIVQHNLTQFMRHPEKQDKPGNLHIHLFRYIKQNPGGLFNVEVIFRDPKQYQLLIVEQAALDESAQDPNCLNNSFEAYIPLYREETKMWGWINKGAHLNYKKWMKKNHPER